MNATPLFRTHVIEGASAGPHLLITGGVHGDEFEPMPALRRLTTATRAADLRGRLTLVPIVNEPAFLRGCRTADDGLDLARTCPGRPDGSITERIAAALSELIETADYYIDLHTGGTQLSVLPLAGYMLHPDAEVLDWQRRMARAFNLPLVWGTSPQLQGRTLSVARDERVPAIYAEYEGSAVCSREGIAAYFEGCLNVMRELGMIERALPRSKVEHVVEDPRPDSGHLQIANPAPQTGYFDSAVVLGQRVSAGDLLGTVTDPLGTDAQEVRSHETGIVVCLTTFPRVLQGGSVAVILEI